MASQHKSVLLEEVITALNIQPEGCYIDATFGRGGHSQAILAKLTQQGRLLVIDQDAVAIDYAKQHFGHDPRVSIHQGSFTDLAALVQNKQWQNKVNGILLDLGVSSPQLDVKERGFSFQKTGPLDMRMDTSSSLTAAAWIAKTSESDIAKVLWEYGEERHSRRIAKAIVSERKQKPITTTTALAALIAKVIPGQPGKHPATRSFQAIRIAVNQEFTRLEQVLAQCLDALAIGGRLVVISFHSLEDQIVKNFIRHWTQGGIPTEVAVPEHQLKRRLRAVGRLIRPTEQEVYKNPRARSARCRVMEKIK